MNSNVVDLWFVAGWTMVHFLWLGALVAVAAALTRLALRRASANLRYTFTLAWLLALAALPFATATFLVSRDPGAPGRSVPHLQSNVNPWQSPPTTSSAPGFQTYPTISMENDFRLPPLGGEGWGGGQNQGLTAPTFTHAYTLFERAIPYLPLLWLIGTPITLALLLTGIVGSRRLSRASHEISEGATATLLARLTTSLNITRRVTVAICDRIAAPVLIGIIRPVILLPPAALTGWSPDEIEMVLLHELAHVRRWDNLVNLLQRFIESLLFFHPAVWLISSWVRHDRESCCDALVVGRTNRPHAYAEMLVALAAQMPRSVLFHPAASSAMAAGPLRHRIRRILQLEDDPMLVSGKSLALMLGSLLITGTLAVLYFPTLGQAEPTTASTASAKPTDLDITPSEVKGTIASPVSVTVTPLGKENGVTIDAGEVSKMPAGPAEMGTTKFTLNTAHDKDPSGKFPSLEEQRLADLAFQRLGLEMEPMTPDDLKRVQALGYNGGVKVTTGSAGFPGQNPLEAGDILLGLHAWPTTSMQALADVITRADIAQYNPLKFQALFQSTTFTDDGKPVSKDYVKQGRVRVELVGGHGANPFGNPIALPEPVATKKQDDRYTRKSKQNTATAVDNTYQFPGGEQPASQNNPFAALPTKTTSDSDSAPSSNTPREIMGAMSMMGPGKVLGSTTVPDRTIVAYDVPANFRQSVEMYAQNATIEFMWDQKGRCVIQGNKDQQERFKSLLDSTAKWREVSAADDAKREPVETTTDNSETILHWRAAGLELAFNPEFQLVVVKEVAPGSPAAWLDIRPGDALTRIERFSVGSIPEAESILNTLITGFSDDLNSIESSFARQTDGRGPTYTRKSLPLKAFAEKLGLIGLPGSTEVK